MNLLEWNIWRGGLFKQAKYLVSTPRKSQLIIYFSEAGIISFEYLPIDGTGFVTAEEAKKSWIILHQLKVKVCVDHIPTGQTALLISDRSYIPIDIGHKLKPKDRDSLTSLKDIAEVNYDTTLANTKAQSDPNTRTRELIINWSFAVLMFLGVITLVKGCG